MEDRGIAKRLDRFFISDHLSELIMRYRSWNVSSTISDHTPICLQFELDDSPHNFPFKFNHHWLENSAFQNMVRGFWCSVQGVDGLLAMDLMSEKLLNLKILVRKWDRA